MNRNRESLARNSERYDSRWDYQDLKRSRERTPAECADYNFRRYGDNKHEYEPCETQPRIIDPPELPRSAPNAPPRSRSPVSPTPSSLWYTSGRTWPKFLKDVVKKTKIGGKKTQSRTMPRILLGAPSLAPANRPFCTKNKKSRRRHRNKSYTN